MDDCIFCKIVSGQIPSQKVFEDDNVLAFRDINPAAPVHILVVPKQHISGLDEVDEANSAVLGPLFVAIAMIAQREEELKMGYRVVSNVGEYAGQSVGHLHFHIIGGRRLDLKMG